MLHFSTELPRLLSLSQLDLNTYQHSYLQKPASSAASAKGHRHGASEHAFTDVNTIASFTPDTS